MTTYDYVWVIIQIMISQTIQPGWPHRAGGGKPGPSCPSPKIIRLRLRWVKFINISHNMRQAGWLAAGWPVIKMLIFNILQSQPLQNTHTARLCLENLDYSFIMFGLNNQNSLDIMKQSQKQLLMILKTIISKISFNFIFKSTFLCFLCLNLNTSICY